MSVLSSCLVRLMGAVAINPELSISPQMASEVSKMFFQQHSGCRIMCMLLERHLKSTVHTAFSITRRVSQTGLYLSQPGQQGGSLQARGSEYRSPTPDSWLLGRRNKTTTDQNPAFTLREFLTDMYQSEPNVTVDVPS